MQRVISSVSRFLAVVLMSSFLALIVIHYFSLKTESDTLGEGLDMYIFFSKNVQDYAEVSREIDSLELLEVDEFVPQADAYDRAIEKNPSLASIPVDKSTAFEAYIIARPNQIPSENYLGRLETEVYKIDGVEEMVYDREGFLAYGKILTDLSNYRLIAYILSCTFALLFIIRLIASLFASRRRFFAMLVDFAVYIVASAGGVWLLWALAQTLSISFLIDVPVLLVIPFCAVTATVFKR
jgi:hypothetical protein